MNKINSFLILLFLVGSFSLATCKKTASNTTIIVEPITIIKPDSTNTRLFVKNVMPLEIQFTTDTIIDWVRGLYEIDTSHSATHVYSYPDTLFYTNLDSLKLKQNMYKYKNGFTVPDTLKTGDVVRFSVSMKANSKMYEKEFKITVR